MFSPCLWPLSRDEVKTRLTLQIATHPSLSGTQLAFGTEWREEHQPRVITEFSWFWEFVQGEKQRSELQPPCQHSRGIPSFLLTLSDLEDQSVCMVKQKGPSYISPGETVISAANCKNPGIFFGNFPSGGYD